MQEVITFCVAFFVFGVVVGWGVYSFFYAFKVTCDVAKEISRND